MGIMILKPKLFFFIHIFSYSVCKNKYEKLCWYINPQVAQNINHLNLKNWWKLI